MKILVMCSAGMSTSLLVNKMQQQAQARGQSEVRIQAEPVDELLRHVDEYDVFLLGPQVKYKEEWVKGIVERKGKPYANISPLIYGRVDGAATLELALSLCK